MSTLCFVSCAAELRRIICIEQYLKMCYVRFSSTAEKNRQSRKELLMRMVEMDTETGSYA